MVKNVSAAAFPAVVGDYISPESRIIDFQPQGVLCTSIINVHQEFEMDKTEDL
jgi:hypothetical protein